MRLKFRREGIGFYGLSFLLFFFFLFFNKFLSILFFILTLFFLYFFRDPEREIPEEGVVSPADGKVVELKELDDSYKISIFMSPFNVHVNRAPIEGKIFEINYKKGKKYKANSNKASFENESNSFKIKNETEEVFLRQIAGILARRIVFFKKEGDFINKGERFGLIMFGSRVELILPKKFDIIIKEGEKVYAGATIIAKEKKA